MDERGGLKGLTRPLPPHIRRRQPAQLAINERRQVVGVSGTIVVCGRHGSFGLARIIGGSRPANQEATAGALSLLTRRIRIPK